jgi:hypothetical protein
LTVALGRIVLVTTAAAPAARAVPMASAFHESGPEARIRGFFSSMPHKVTLISAIVFPESFRFRRIF